MRGMHVSIPVSKCIHIPFKSENRSQITEMQNVHVVSSPLFDVLCDGALVFALSLILCTGKWIKLFAETVLAFSVE
jgi:hypothetical protein